MRIAGTNGKGAVACVLEAAARRAGLRTGLFTSPHLHRFAERIRIDGRPLPDDRLAIHLDRALRAVPRDRGASLTFFEVATLAAFEAFAAERVELAVLEVGLGGRLDATAIAPVDAAAVVSIGLDHTELLGSTLGEVAREKAGAAQPGAPLVAGPLAPEALEEVTRAAAAIGSPLSICGRDFHLDPELRAPWPGRHQRENLAVARRLWELLAREDPRLTSAAFVEALEDIERPGRYETIETERRYLLDGAHNLEAVRGLVDAIEERGDRFEVLLFGALKGKPAEAMLDLLLPRVREAVLAPPPVPRALDPAELVSRRGLRSAAGVERALELLPPGPALVTGSLFTVAEARRILLGERVDPPIAM